MDSSIIHADATYKLTVEKYPVLVLGTTKTNNDVDVLCSRQGSCRLQRWLYQARAQGRK